jgi:hypothetical protein
MPNVSHFALFLPNPINIDELRTSVMGLQLFIRFLLQLAIIMLPACSTVADRKDYAETIAQHAGMTKEVFNTGQFILTTYSKLGSKNSDLLVVYIEGDGHAFQRKRRPSPDPTPKTPVALELAATDPNLSVLYIARPCQYLSAEQLKDCDTKYWTTHRYSEEAVAAINQVISQFAAGYKEIGLSGYSGGGTVATLIAARHSNIKWLVTVAANLNHKAWTEFHHVSPLSGSLNAADMAPLLKNTLQKHYVGGKDKIVPEEITLSYMTNIGENSNAKVIIKPDFDHQCCWVRDWTELLCKSGDVFSAYCR